MSGDTHHDSSKTMTQTQHTDAVSIEDYLQEPECQQLLAVVMDVAEPSTLDYEDVAQPLKLSGGHLCLRETGRYGQEVIWYCWEPRGMRAVAIGNDGDKTAPDGPQEAVRWLQDALATPDNLSPVIRERSPFEPLEAGQ